MMRRTFVFLLSLYAHAAYAGAWTQPANHGQFILQSTYFASDAYYNRAGDRTDQPTYHKLELQPYAEWGLSDAYTIGGDAYLQHDWQQGNSNDGLADPEIFLRARLYHSDQSVLSLQPLIKLPSSFTDQGAPRGGSNGKDAELSLLYGRNFNLLSNNDYLDTRIGYRARGGQLHNQTKVDLALGLSPAPKWQILPAVRYVQADSLGSPTAFSEDGEMDYDLLKAELGVAYHPDDKQWLQLTGFDHLWGRQTGNGTGITISYGVNF